MLIQNCGFYTSYREIHSFHIISVNPFFSNVCSIWDWVSLCRVRVPEVALKLQFWQWVTWLRLLCTSLRSVEAFSISQDTNSAFHSPQTAGRHQLQSAGEPAAAFSCWEAKCLLVATKSRIKEEWMSSNIRDVTPMSSWVVAERRLITLSIVDRFVIQWYLK